MFIGVLSDDVVFCVGFLPAYDIKQILVCFNVQVIGGFYVFPVDVLGDDGDTPCLCGVLHFVVL